MHWFQKEFDWDFMKVNPRADYHVQDWGVKLKLSTRELENHVKQSFPVSKVEGWANIKQLPVTSPTLAEHLKLVSLLRARSGKELPILMTVFTPLSVAGRMVPEHQMLVAHLRSAPEKVHAVLRVITDTFVRFVAELRNAGADGLFFATTHWASADLLTWEEYQEFGIPYDLEVIQAAESDALNLFHVCGANNFLTQLVKQPYPAKMINWDSADPTNLPLDKADGLFPDKTLVGGVDYQGWLKQSRPDEMAYFVQGLKRQFDSARLIIAPGCAIEPSTDLNNLRAIRQLL
jgi:uroporphyrinogen decarboxylase